MLPEQASITSSYQWRIWVARTGVPGALPARFGKHDTLRSRRWAPKGIWQRSFKAVQEPIWTG